MNRQPAPLPRLIEQPPVENPAEVTLLLRSAIDAPAEDTPRVKWRVCNTLYQEAERRRRVLRFALVAVCTFVAGGVVGAAVQPLLRSASPPSLDEEREPTSPASHGVRKRARGPIPGTVPAGKATPTETAVEPAARELASAPGPVAIPPTLGAPAGGDTGPRARRVAQTSTARGRSSTAATPSTTTTKASQALAPPAQPPPVIPAPPLPTPAAPAATPVATGPTNVTLPAEQALIATALEKLRTSHDPEGALVALDEHRRRFPASVLAPEAARLRTEAHLLLGRRSAVLNELDRPEVPGGPTSDERLVLRGELRAAGGSWRSALADFDAVLRAHPTTGVGSPDDQRTAERVERALWGRASARSRLGDEAGARADLRDYLRRFPDGRFTTQANRLLGEQR